MCADQINRIVDENLSSMFSVEGNLLSATGGTPPRTILVSSARPREGKTTCAVALAHSLAQGGAKRVILAEGNLREPALHRVLGIEASPGLADWLSNGTDVHSVLRKTKQANLEVLPCGSNGQQRAGQLDMKVFETKMQSLRESHDYVVFDGAAILNASDACLMAQYFDGVILVAECGKTKWQVVELAKNMVTQAGGNVLGVILNKRRYYVPRFFYENV